MLQQLIKKNRLVISMLVIITSIGSLETAKAQMTAQQVMQQVYQAYDSLSYISFDVKYVYGTDTLYGDFKSEVMKGTYTMAGKKAKYNIGDIDFMQNDSFLVAVYNRDKFIIVSDPHTTNTGAELPMRSLMDSMLQVYGQHYTISSGVLENTGIIQFIKADTLAQFNSFRISYNPANYYLSSIEYNFQTTEPLPTIDANDTTNSFQMMPPTIFSRIKRFRIEFSNYRMDNFLENIYSENNYIWFEDGECKPVEKYKDFKVYYTKAVNN